MTVVSGVLIVVALLIRHGWADYIVIGAAFALSVASYTVRRRLRSDAYRDMRLRRSQGSGQR